MQPEQVDYLYYNVAEDSTTPIMETVKIITKVDDFFALRDEWNAINRSSPKDTIFNSWEWLYTWWETYKDDGNRQLYILTCKNWHNKLIGIAPFQIIKNPKKYFPCSRQLTLLGTGETDGSFVFGEYMDLIIETGYENAVIRAISGFLTEHNSLWDGLKFHELLIDSYLSRLFSEKYYVEKSRFVKTVKGKGFRTYIDLPETYKDYLMSLRKKMRNNITRNVTRLKSEQEFTIETINEVSQVDETITLLAELNRSRRDSLDERSAFESDRFTQFHKRVVKRLLPLQNISLRVLQFKDKPVAALYSFIDGDTIHPYQSGFDTKYGQRYSLLTMMLTQEIENSIENPELRRFNFMYSDEETTYKMRYSGTTEKMYTLSYDKPGLKFGMYRFIHGPVKTSVKKFLKRE